jgi:NAD(P)-dependent dehydrogenase (short-subunit alcohol dehydrogenase family)
MTDLKDKSVVITGAASGIGRASALAFAKAGARLLISDVNANGLEETQELVGELDGSAITVIGDASDEAVVKSLIERACEINGGIDAFFANAGISGDLVPLADTTVEQFMRVLQVNLIGPFLAIKHTAPRMVAQGKGGAIVCTASVAGIRSAAGPTAYSASKAGVINLVQTAANQFAGNGIRINAICPGLIETGMTQPIFDHARAAGKAHKLGQLTPLRRAGVASEIAEVAVFLASDRASYINGQAIAVDGGLTSTLPFVPGRIL